MRAVGTAHVAETEARVTPAARVVRAGTAETAKTTRVVAGAATVDGAEVEVVVVEVPTVRLSLCRGGREA